MNNSGEQLYRACESGNSDEVRRLIDAGADVNYSNALWTNLHIAVHKANVPIVQLLLSSGANVNSRSRTNRTPLHVAAVSDNLELVELLLQHGSDPAILSTIGETAEDEARERHHSRVVELFSDFYYPEIKEPDCL